MIDGFDTNSLILTFFMFGGVTVFGLLRAVRYPSATTVGSWMIDHGLDPESGACDTVATYLRRTRWIRTIGFLVGWNVPFVWMWVTRSAYRMDELGTYWWLVGFALGILLAEIARPRPTGAGTVAEPRRLSHYLPDSLELIGGFSPGLPCFRLRSASCYRLPTRSSPTRQRSSGRISPGTPG